jgi:tRNA G18 (ribose-2'-O)-methylase SpoU
MTLCPLCGSELVPQGKPFINSKRISDQDTSNKDRVVEVVLDNLRSTLNVGAIFRTADGAGVNKIYCCGTTPTPEHPKIAKTSLGAEDFTPWEYRSNALDLVKMKKQEGYQIFSLEASEIAQPILKTQTMDKEMATLLVVGNEVSGIDPEIMEISTKCLYIPMRGNKTSLNVAVAFGIAIYSLIN